MCIKRNGKENEKTHGISLVHRYLVQVQVLGGFHFNESQTNIALGQEFEAVPPILAMKQLAGGWNEKEFLFLCSQKKDRDCCGLSHASSLRETEMQPGYLMCHSDF